MVMTVNQRGAYDLRRAAVREGYKYVELGLKETYHHDTMDPVIVSGVMELRGTKSGMKNGRQNYNVFALSGNLKFEFNSDAAEFRAWMVIDKEDGLYGRKSYNLDFLASHNKNPIFYIIDDSTVKDEIEIRVVLMRKKVASRAATASIKRSKVRTAEERNENEDIELQLLALKEKEKELLLRKKINKPEPEPTTEPETSRVPGSPRPSRNKSRKKKAVLSG